jgi:hypothetical protein
MTRMAAPTRPPAFATDQHECCPRSRAACRRRVGVLAGGFELDVMLELVERETIACNPVRRKAVGPLDTHSSRTDVAQVRQGRARRKDC